MADTGVPARSSVLAPSAAEIVVGLLGAVVISVVANSLIALIAIRFIPEGTDRVGLAVVEYGPASVIGVVVGAIGWYLIRRHTADPKRVLRVVVPVSVLVSFIPDLGILAGGATFVNSFALMHMHAVVAAATVLVLVRVLPLSKK
ncbi:PEP-CTERM protein-sorting domain-containing protein [Lentzea fradiae]|uniref:PEP-CTERM protein-sorting domain-containing protein n=1 Tax=Lentzea fradiae TaxID=200378 RepID=A0A1G7KPT4_9PSEU|nr:DUF6069 family protein [Lentzea fradiae]SDF39185.1 PEP-CTERM protein-sorting domain-containing protein [Lentzea fradiae]